MNYCHHRTTEENPHASVKENSNSESHQNPSGMNPFQGILSDYCKVERILAIGRRRKGVVVVDSHHSSKPAIFLGRERNRFRSLRKKRDVKLVLVLASGERFLG